MTWASLPPAVRRPLLMLILAVAPVSAAEAAPVGVDDLERRVAALEADVEAVTAAHETLCRQLAADPDSVERLAPPDPTVEAVGEALGREPPPVGPVLGALTGFDPVGPCTVERPGAPATMDAWDKPMLAARDAAASPAEAVEVQRAWTERFLEGVAFGAGLAREQAGILDARIGPETTTLEPPPALADPAPAPESATSTLTRLDALRPRLWTLHVRLGQLPRTTAEPFWAGHGALVAPIRAWGRDHTRRLGRSWVQRDTATVGLYCASRTWWPDLAAQVPCRGAHALVDPFPALPTPSSSLSHPPPPGSAPVELYVAWGSSGPAPEVGVVLADARRQGIPATCLVAPHGSSLGFGGQGTLCGFGKATEAFVRAAPSVGQTAVVLARQGRIVWAGQAFQYMPSFVEGVIAGLQESDEAGAN